MPQHWPPCGRSLRLAPVWEFGLLPCDPAIPILRRFGTQFGPSSKVYFANEHPKVPGGGKMSQHLSAAAPQPGGVEKDKKDAPPCLARSAQELAKRSGHRARTCVHAGGGMIRNGRPRASRTVRVLTWTLGRAVRRRLSAWRRFVGGRMGRWARSRRRAWASGSGGGTSSFTRTCAGAFLLRPLRAAREALVGMHWRRQRSAGRCVHVTSAGPSWSKGSRSCGRAPLASSHVLEHRLPFSRR